MNRDKLCTYPSWEALMKYWNTQIVTDHLYTTDESGVCNVINRPSVGGAVLQTPSLLIKSVSQSVTDAFPPDLQNIITPKPLELES